MEEEQNDTSACDTEIQRNLLAYQQYYQRNLHRTQDGGLHNFANFVFSSQSPRTYRLVDCSVFTNQVLRDRLNLWSSRSPCGWLNCPVTPPQKVSCASKSPSSYINTDLQKHFKLVLKNRHSDNQTSSKQNQTVRQSRNKYFPARNQSTDCRQKSGTFNWEAVVVQPSPPQRQYKQNSGSYTPKAYQPLRATLKNNPQTINNKQNSTHQRNFRKLEIFVGAEGSACQKDKLYRTRSSLKWVLGTSRYAESICRENRV